MVSSISRYSRWAAFVVPPVESSFSQMVLAAGVDVADDTLLVDEEGNGGPRLYLVVEPPAVERYPIRVEGHREGEAEALGRPPQPFDAPIAGRLGVKDADDPEAPTSVLAVELPQHGRRRGAKGTSVRPPTDE